MMMMMMSIHDLGEVMDVAWALLARRTRCRQAWAGRG